MALSQMLHANPHSQGGSRTVCSKRIDGRHVIRLTDNKENT
jgi:hypothetical protein